MLRGLRILDLTDERGLLCGRLLADFGADVVQVELRGGCDARSAEPLDADGVSGFVWHAFAAGKRGIEIDFNDETERNVLLGLVSRADAIVTSWDRSELDQFGLTPDDLIKLHPDLVVTTISAFGWSGPKADISATDITVWAAGGALGPHRDEGLPPVGMSVPQAFLHAAADAAAGTLLALLERKRSGLGQHVDVSAQVSVSQATLSRVLAAAVGDESPEWQRSSNDRSGSGAATPNSLKKWHVKDGLVELHLSMGAAAGAFTNRLFEWIGEMGELDPESASIDWRTLPDQLAAGEKTAEDLDRARQCVRVFLRERTKAEVLNAAISRRLLCIPIFDIGEVARSEQLLSREFFTEIDIAGRPGLIPAVPAQVRGAPRPHARGSGPSLDEHWEAVLEDWLGPKNNRGISESEHGVIAPDGLHERLEPLVGLRVLDLSWVVAGPLIGRTLADFGADVIRIESSKRIDTARMMPPFHGGVADPEGSVLYGNCNAGKRGLALDLTSEQGQKIVRELAARADVVVESFAPGQLAKWGLTADSLREENPDLIVLSTSIAGQTGPWSKLAGFGNVGSSLSGFQLLVGWPDRLPFGPFGPYTDYVGPRISLIALLSALFYRGNGGSGCVIDVSQIESGVYFLSPQIAQATRDGIIADRRGNSSARYAPQGVYPTAGEQFVALTVTEDAQWAVFADLIGRPDLSHRVDLRTAPGRCAAQQEIDDAISQWSSTQQAESVANRIQDVGIPAYVALLPEDYLKDEQLRFREHLVELRHPLHSRTVVEGARIHLTRTPGGPKSSAPMFGEHADEILQEELGYSIQVIKDLADKGVLR